MERPQAPRPRLLAELSYEEAERWRLRDPLVLLPIGATEAHGPHLPLGTDVMLSEGLALRAGGALAAMGYWVLIAPSLAYAVTEFGAPFCGTVSVSAAAAEALLVEVCVGLCRGGFSRVCLVNSHLEWAHVAVLRRAAAAAEARTGRKVAFPDQMDRRWARTLTPEYRRGNCHAGRYETALLLASRPELVRGAEELPPNEADFLGRVQGGAGTFAEAGGPRAYFGNPAAATPEEGEAIYALLVEMVVTTVKEAWPA